jgi:DNA-binding NarL/FixJ family response regulator
VVNVLVEPSVAGSQRSGIAVLVASGDRPVLRMVVRFLATFSGITVVGLADTIDEAAALTAALRADVLLLDSNLITAAASPGRADHRFGPGTEVIALVDAPGRVNGAGDFPFVVTKSRLAAELVPCIRRAAAMRK